jgi:chaperonin GroES
MANEFSGLKPLSDRVLLRVLDSNDKIGSILVPDKARERPTEAIVIATGPGAYDQYGEIIPLEVQTGDKVLFGKYTGTEINIQGNRYLILKESEILGIFE